MKTDNVRVLPGVERRDIGTPVPSETVLQGAIDKGIQDVIVVGLQGRELYLAAEHYDADALIGKLQRAIHFLVTHEVTHNK